MAKISGPISGFNTETDQAVNISESCVTQKHLDRPSAVESMMVKTHPLGVKPSGNAYGSEVDIKMATGNLARLSDEIVLQVLEYVDALSLICIGSTCKALFAFSRFEDLWKSLYLESSPAVKVWQGSWRSTYLDRPGSPSELVQCTGLFSDALHRPYLCANTPLGPFAGHIPVVNAIQRMSDLSAHEFVDRWTDEPFILTSPVKEWPVYREWSLERMLEDFGKLEFRAEAVDWPLQTYVDYMNRNADESPLYLFDRSFVEKTGIRVGDSEGAKYWPPRCFGEDLFSVLEHQRPDSRWLIIGPERSGSTFHKDPNATSAWNAVIRGSKYWILFPSSSKIPPPPGVYVSEDQSEVTSPLSIAEWLLGYHAEARRLPGCKEAVCGEGEILHVPSGWWHLVVNLESSIALTQNFVPERHLSKVLDFLETKPGQVSGFDKRIENPYALFVCKMQATHPEVIARALKGREIIRKGKKRRWEELVKGADCAEEGSSRFSFAFGGLDDADVS